MKRLLSVLTLVCILRAETFGACALGTGTPTLSVSSWSSANSQTSAAWTLSGSNLAIVLTTAIDSATATVTSVSFSGGGGTAVEIKTQRNTTTYVSVWCIPAPVSGGAYTINYSATIAGHVTASYFTGVNQTTPCPTGDAVSTTGTSQTSLTVDPTNVTANDCQMGMGAQTVAGDVSSFSPNQTYLSTSQSVNAEAGYRIGTGSLTANWTNVTGAIEVLVGVRVADVGGGAAATPRLTLLGAGR